MDTAKIIAFLKGKKRYLISGAIAISIYLKLVGFEVPEIVFDLFRMANIDTTVIEQTTNIVNSVSE